MMNETPEAALRSRIADLEQQLKLADEGTSRLAQRCLELEKQLQTPAKIYYKFEGNAPEYISKDLQECAKMVSELDDKMLSLNEAIRECIAQQDKDQIQMNEELMNDVCRDVLGNNKEYKDSKVQEKVTEIVT